MRPIPCLFRCCLLALVIIAKGGSIALADPLVPTKIPTLRIGPSAGDQPELSTFPTDSSKAHIITARPRPAGERRDASGRASPAELGPGAPTPDPDRRSVDTIPIRPNPASTRDPDHRIVRTLPVPSQVGQPTGYFAPPRNPDP